MDELKEDERVCYNISFIDLTLDLIHIIWYFSCVNVIWWLLTWNQFRPNNMKKKESYITTWNLSQSKYRQWACKHRKRRSGWCSSEGQYGVVVLRIASLESGRCCYSSSYRANLWWHWPSAIGEGIFREKLLEIKWNIFYSNIMWGFLKDDILIIHSFRNMRESKAKIQHLEVFRFNKQKIYSYLQTFTRRTS